MKLRNKVLLSILVGLAAMFLSSTPMWWGVVFSPLSQPLTTEQTAGEEESGQVTLGLKSLDLLRGLFFEPRK